MAQLEEQLELEDKCGRQDPNEQFADNGTFRYDRRPERQKILADLTQALERYHELYC